MVIFWTFLEILKTKKCPLQQNGEKMILPYAVIFKFVTLSPNIWVHFYPPAGMFWGGYIATSLVSL